MTELNSNTSAAMPASSSAGGAPPLREHLETVRAAAEELIAQEEHLQTEVQRVQAKAAALHEERVRLEAERDHLHEARAQVEAERDHLQIAVAERDKRIGLLDQRCSNLQTDLLEMYRDLRADDLPTLILRVALRLTEAEQGLYLDEDCRTPLSAVGLEDMSRAPAEGLFRIAQRACDEEEAVICNDSSSLPDGMELVNLAAVPVALKGEHHGILLVANKRHGEFSQEDTDLLLSIGQHACVALQNNRLHAELEQAFRGTVAVLADAIEAKDPYTRGHCESVADNAVAIAERFGLECEDLERVRTAALLHDVGKIAVSDGILLKPGRLLPEEYQLIQRHSAVGRDLVSRVPSLAEVAPLILYHHERMDGSGYPNGLAGDAIPLGARIIAVCDAFDAMTTTRPYRAALPQNEALAELRRGAGAQFDAEIVAALEAVLVKRETEARQTKEQEVGETQKAA